MAECICPSTGLAGGLKTPENFYRARIGHPFRGGLLHEEVWFLKELTLGLDVQALTGLHKKRRKSEKRACQGVDRAVWVAYTPPTAAE
jgi:hypothetical protein